MGGGGVRRRFPKAKVGGRRRPVRCRPRSRIAPGQAGATWNRNRESEAPCFFDHHHWEDVPTFKAALSTWQRQKGDIHSVQKCGKQAVHVTLFGRRLAVSAIMKIRRTATPQIRSRRAISGSVSSRQATRKPLS